MTKIGVYGLFGAALCHGGVVLAGDPLGDGTGDPCTSNRALLCQESRVDELWVTALGELLLDTPLADRLNDRLSSMSTGHTGWDDDDDDDDWSYGDSGDTGRYGHGGGNGRGGMDEPGGTDPIWDTGEDEKGCGCSTVSTSANAAFPFALLAIVALHRRRI